MRKVIAAMNMSLDGFCDHTLGIADDETHQHYSELMKSADVLLYGRTTYQLMESYWPNVVENPTGNKPTDEFAILIDDISKVVFSHTLDHVSWKNSRLATHDLAGEISKLKQKSGKPIFIGSPGLIAQATNLNLVDEFQMMVHPVIAGKGLTLFKNISDQVDLKLLQTKTFKCGAIILYYKHSKV